MFGAGFIISVSITLVILDDTDGGGVLSDISNADVFSANELSSRSSFWKLETLGLTIYSSDLLTEINALVRKFLKRSSLDNSFGKQVWLKSPSLPKAPNLVPESDRLMGTFRRNPIGLSLIHI